MQYTRNQSPNLKRGGSEPNLPRKQNMVPQPTQALNEFVKHVDDPLVDKGWNLNLKFGKGEPQKEEFVQGTTPMETSTKAVDKEKVCSLSREKQTPLEMGTGGEAEVKGVVEVEKDSQKIKLNLGIISRKKMMKMIQVQKLHLNLR